MMDSKYDAARRNDFMKNEIAENYPIRNNCFEVINPDNL